MPLVANATMTFIEYIVNADYSVTMVFQCLLPGPGMPTEYPITITQAEVTGINSQSQFTSLVRSKLDWQYRHIGVSSKLDGFIGQSLILP